MPKAPPTSIRLSEDMYERIKRQADKEKRSISSQIEYNLEQYFEITDRFKTPVEKANAG